jgi:hypothetical protein
LPDDVEIEIFDYHQDIDVQLSGTRSLLFSPHTKYGYNPLIVNTDIHYGGIRRAITDVISAINATTNNLGARQVNVLRNLMLDTYAERGMFPDDPKTWFKKTGTSQERQALLDAGNIEALNDYYPTLRDVLDMARRRLHALLIGVDDEGGGAATLNNLKAFLKVRSSLKRASDAIAQGTTPASSLEALHARHDGLLDECVAQFRAYLESTQTGQDLDDAMNYSNKELLQSVAVRLEGLIDVGIFEPNPPPWGGARVRRHILRPLAQSPDELLMFIRFRLQAIIREMMQSGAVDGRLRRIIVLDESKIFNSEDMNNPINIIATQMRKFGIGLLLAAQSPAHFSDDFLKNAGTLFLLALATADWDDAARRLKIAPEILKYLKPREVAAIRLIENGGAAKFKSIYLR